MRADVLERLAKFFAVLVTPQARFVSHQALGSLPGACRKLPPRSLALSSALQRSLALHLAFPGLLVLLLGFPQTPRNLVLGPLPRVA